MKSTFKLTCILSLSFVLNLIACGQDSIENTTSVSYQSNSNLTDEYQDQKFDEAELTQQLPLEFELTHDEKILYREVLQGIYQELVQNHSSAMSQASDPNENCDRCGRETGFLPSPELYINQFLHVDMKAFTFGLFAWDINLDLITDMLNEFMGEASLTEPSLSHRLTIVRVDLSLFTESMQEQAINGTLLTEQSPDSVSITSITTNAEELGINLDHGYSYVVFAYTVESVTKLSSEASAPLMLHCFVGGVRLAQEQSSPGGCMQLNQSMNDNPLQ